MPRFGIADIEGHGRIVSAARKQLGRFRRAFDILAGDAGDEVPGKILDQADAAALRRKGQVARRRRTDIAGIAARSNSSGMNAGVVPARLTCSMRPAICALVVSVNFNSLNDVAGDVGVLVGIPQAVERAAGSSGLGAVSS